MAMLWASPGPLLRPVVLRKLSLHGPTLRTCIQRRGLITLGIETSCDDTCVAVLDTKVDGTRQTAYLRTNKRVTCANKHHQGVHPVEAVESHTRNLPRLLNEVLESTLKPPPDLIAVTRGPGMKPCLNVGVSFAKGLSVAWGVPLIGVHHMQAHALTPHLEAALARGVNIDAHEPQYPFLTLLVSGGHTMLVYTKSAIEHRVLASTQRGIVIPIEKGSATAVGEMLDKCARAIVPEKFIPHANTVAYANIMDSYCWQNSMYDSYQAPQKSEVYQSKIGPWSIPPPLRQSQDMIYDFTGLGGKVRAIMRERPDMPINERYDLAYATMRLAFEHIMSRVIMALENDKELLANPPQSLVISGGVARNRFLRTIVTSTLQARGFGNVTVTAPKPHFCTDNAAMVAWAGLKMYEAGWTTDESFLPQGEWPIEQIITGVDCWLQNGVAASPESTSKTAASQRDEAQLPDKPKPQDPPLPSTADVPAEHDAVAGPNAGAAHQRKTNAKSVTPTEDENFGSKSKSDNKKPRARPDLGPSSAQDGQHAPDGEGPGSPQEDTARTSPSQATDRSAQSGRSARAPKWRTKGKAQPVGTRRVLNDPSKQLLIAMARRRARPPSLPRPSLGLRDSNETPPVDGRIAEPDSDKRLAGGLDSTKKRVTDGAKREPLRVHKVQIEGKEEVKTKEEEEKKERRVVRLLPPAPAVEQAPERSLRTGLDRLRRWMGLLR
ncbi:hypothetical protein FJTKL_05795 [Diaporthe vaccinii]|uniref:N(6)-L-threonylcarbamoyladenine synthase n=3 Tax=Diaporthe vaccinii TaxID=105482 RepID=A0ABR4EXX1_9PEZI